MTKRVCVRVSKHLRGSFSRREVTCLIYVKGAASILAMTSHIKTSNILAILGSL
jgi:hypothetical protein